MFKYLLIIELLIAAQCSYAQLIEYNKVAAIKELIEKNKEDTNRIKLLWEMGRTYLLRRGDYQNDLDSASFFFQKAKILSDLMMLSDMKMESICRMGETSLQTGNIAEGKKYFAEAVSYYQSINNKEKEAETWMRMGYSTYRESSSYGYFYSFPVTKLNETQLEIINWFSQAKSIYQKNKNKNGLIEALRQIADIHLNQGKLDTAENELMNVLEMYKSAGFKNLHYTYDLLSVTNRLKGNYNKALYYSLEAIKSAQLTKDSVSLSHFYLSLAHVYHELGQLEKSIGWYKNALERFKLDSFPKPNLYRVAGYLSTTLIETKREKDALSFLLRLNKEIPPYSFLDKEINARSMGNCYDVLKQYDLAEKYYLQMIEWDDKLNIGGISSEAYYSIGKFYFNQHKYDKAAVYLKKILELPKGVAIIALIKDAHFLLFRTDSATENYFSAIKHFQQYKLLNDSIFNEAKSRQIEELQIQYQTAKNEENIKTLNNQTLIQQNELKQAMLEKNITIGGVAMLLLFTILLYNRYRLKQRINKQLESSQAEIHKKNSALNNLITGQDKLLAEKEWLLKEVHHRVKNNLQIIVSLLESQSSYLEKDALNAVKNIEHRVFSMSLLHQKLFQSGNLSNINMTAYVSELIHYLSESFNAKQRIRFRLHINQIELNILQAGPLGLILNEAITNAIKHAFPTNANNEINIKISDMENGFCELRIADNGIGLSPDFQGGYSNSLGLKLIRGLTEEIGGSLNIEKNNGTIVTIRFIKTNSTLVR
jgi:two-component system, sensor histidine kinase PdtaS